MVAQAESNAQTRLANLKAAADKVQARMEDQKTRLTEQLQKEGESVDALSADLRKKNQMVVELQQAIKDQQDAAKSAAELTQVNLRALPSELSSSSATATSAGTVSNELAVATSNGAPINMKFVGVLVGVNPFWDVLHSLTTQKA